MPYHIRGQIYLDILINGVELPPSTNMFDELDIIENVGDVTPTLRIRLSDDISVTTTNLNITDGTKISVQLSVSPEDDEARMKHFTVFSWEMKKQDHSTNIFTINAILDTPKYISGIAQLEIEGSSTDAMRKIASECDLLPIMHETIDQQVWYPMSQTFSGWAKQVADHGYINTRSCMFKCLTSDKELIYKDIIRQSLTPKSEVKATFLYDVAYDSDDIAEAGGIRIPVRRMSTSSKSGLMNNWVNYGYRVNNGSVVSDEVVDNGSLANDNAYGGYEDNHVWTQELVEFRSTTGNIAVNSRIKAAANTARTEYCDFSCNNTFDNYWRAKYQNLRLKVLFTEELTLMVDEFVTLKLLDPVYIAIAQDNATQVPSTKSGIYILIGRTRSVRSGKNLIEKLTFARASITDGSRVTIAT